MTAQFQSASVEVIEHSGVQGNPVLSHVRQGIQLAKEHQVDFVCGVGGGSVIDSAKAIALGAISDCDIWDYFAKKAIAETALPILCVLTLPATGSEMNGISVITNEETWEKNGLNCPGVLNPQISFLDPTTTHTLPVRQMAYACTDILSHMMESYLTTSDETLIVQDALVEGLSRATIESMQCILDNRDDSAGRAGFMWSATLAWNGMCQAGVPGWNMPCHALEMPMSAVYDIAHGAGLSIVIPVWIRVAGSRHAQRICQWGKQVLGLATEDINDVAEALKDFYRRIGSPITFTEAGVEQPDLERLTELAHKSFTSRGMNDYEPHLIHRVYSDAL